MAMVFQCSFLHCNPKLSAFSSLQQILCRKFRFHETNAKSRMSNMNGFFPRESSTSQFLNAIQLFKFGEACNHISQQHSENVQGYVNQEAQIFEFPATAFLLINAVLLGLAMPLEALAETCETDNSLVNMPLLLFVSLVGATVGGLLARQRKGELERLNEQLRQINAALRRQAKIESYAPALSYSPVGSRVQATEVIVDPKKEKVISHLKTGKNYLRNSDPEKAFSEFMIALELAQDLKDPVEEKKAARGVGASLQRQGKYREAIKYHKMVLAISKRVGETSGNTEAYGAIADCYTELGDLENAGKFYDKFIARLEDD
ncbi:hypothetical protein RND81_01G067400 [Saponaria officinalis]|uniref:Protein FLUORESCENT IN BLUE LIGHT, chloroplastic-like n=1 Tax=Saponaria officinalis TaxID=3572 RepID=A0AAW1N8Z9_SAPOF